MRPAVHRHQRGPTLGRHHHLRGEARQRREKRLGRQCHRGPRRPGRPGRGAALLLAPLAAGKVPLHQPTLRPLDLRPIEEPVVPCVPGALHDAHVRHPRHLLHRDAGVHTPGCPCRRVPAHHLYPDLQGHAGHLQRRRDVGRGRLQVLHVRAPPPVPLLQHDRPRRQRRPRERLRGLPRQLRAGLGGLPQPALQRAQRGPPRPHVRGRGGGGHVRRRAVVGAPVRGHTFGLRRRAPEAGQLLVPVLQALLLQVLPALGLLARRPPARPPALGPLQLRGELHLLLPPHLHGRHAPSPRRPAVQAARGQGLGGGGGGLRGGSLDLELPRVVLLHAHVLRMALLPLSGLPAARGQQRADAHHRDGLQPEGLLRALHAPSVAPQDHRSLMPPAAARSPSPRTLWADAFRRALPAR
mmetsp:Transcript_44995/g.143339  ORF Transcript_44995/g.143339 Transcript_44995/m.143339 type:complete len:411 (-) Transcript_44995:63-1295(-)